MSYSINSRPFSDFNMHIIESMGALDYPGRLGEVDYDWGDSNGVEAYVSTADLKWDGREIKLLAYHEGTNLYSAIENLKDEFDGSERTLVTSYGSHTVIIKNVKVTRMFYPNRKALLTLTFWESSVTVPSLPTAVGGSGVKIESYDLAKDFGLYVNASETFFDYSYGKRKRTYGDAVDQIANQWDPRRVTLALNGYYSTSADMISKINNLNAVLRSSGLKTLTYHALTAEVYFADKVTVSVRYAALYVSMKLKLRISSSDVDESLVDGAITFGDQGYITFGDQGPITFGN